MRNGAADRAGVVKSSPGVTTTALALASAWRADGDGCWSRATRRAATWACGSACPPMPGLAGLAAAARHGHEAGLPWRHARELAGGAHLITAPAGAEQAAACVTALAAADLPQELAAGAEPALADCGRLYPVPRPWRWPPPLRSRCWWSGPRVSELAHLEPRIRGLEQAGLRLALILAADDRGGLPVSRPTRPSEIAATLGVPMQATLPGDSRAVEQLCRRAGARAGAAAAAAAGGRRRRRGAGRGPGTAARRASPASRTAGP